MSLKVLIVDDETLARQRLCDLLSSDKEISEISEARNGRETVEILRDKLPDILFLDIQMPHLNGFQVLEETGAEIIKKIPVIIFVTAFDQHALRAFEFYALDYLLKPFSRERFSETLTRAKQKVSETANKKNESRILELLGELNDRPKYQEWITVKKNEKILPYRTSEIQWIEAGGNYAVLKFSDSSEIVRETMDNLEKRLDPQVFVRIHRSTIVNINFIKEIQSWFRSDYRIVMKSGKELILTQRYRDKFMDFFKSKSS